jgi:kynurenine 3-monooxygenase
MTEGKKRISIIGAGLVGCLLSIYLKKRGYQVTVFERRPDMREKGYNGGRSINLALSNRGIRALNEVGLADELKKMAIPMHGRTMHSRDEKLTYQPYGEDGQFINSISRSSLNITLMNEAKRLGVEFFFEHRCLAVDFEHTRLTLQRTTNNEQPTTNSFQRLPASQIINHKADIIIGSDGAFSAVRQAMQVTDRFDYSQAYIKHGYKELHIPASETGGFKLDKNSLHIWPRESFMMIALPNPDGSFTCTLFFPFDGELSFNALDTELKVKAFFEETFPDAVNLMPDYLKTYYQNPAASLVTTKCYPWVKNATLLIGDAAHAIVPFYGQGMNAGFEDCRILNELLDQYQDDWEKVLPIFQQTRKPDADAIAQLALDNFVEMRDLVADEKFLLRKKIEAHLHMLYPDRWIPLYTMVTFQDDKRYSEAYSIGQKQKKIMDKVMSDPDIEANWQKLDFAALAKKL